MQKTEANILIVDDDLDVLVSAQMFLKQLFSLVKVEQRPEKIPGLLASINFDVILLDMNFSKGKKRRRRRDLLAQPYFRTSAGCHCFIYHRLWRD